MYLPARRTLGTHLEVVPHSFIMALKEFKRSVLIVMIIIIAVVDHFYCETNWVKIVARISLQWERMT